MTPKTISKLSDLINCVSFGTFCNFTKFEFFSSLEMLLSTAKSNYNNHYFIIFLWTISDWLPTYVVSQSDIAMPKNQVVFFRIPVVNLTFDSFLSKNLLSIVTLGLAAFFQLLHWIWQSHAKIDLKNST